MMPVLSRRSTLLGLGAAVTLGRASLAVAAAPTDSRFVVVILRGALDGLAAVTPYGDPALMDLRGELVPPKCGEPGGMLDLGGFYGLHPALVAMHDLYAAGELLPVHAVAGPYRVRSHFEAQDLLECGADRRMTSGWLGRAVAALTSGTSHTPEQDAMAVGSTVPLLLRGPVGIGNWAPHGTFSAPPDLYARIAALNEGDSLTGPAIDAGLRVRKYGDSVVTTDDPPGAKRNTLPALASAAGEMLRAPNGPRLVAMELDGWDTHSTQMYRIGGPLKALDAAMLALKTALGPVWKQTAVLVMTEFGRTVRANGTHGTDHGTATVAFVLGGSVAGGSVQATWPGLGAGKLFEDRDLAPTTDLRSVAKGLLAGHLGLSDAALNEVFPGSRDAAALNGLIRA
jgi:uncharacterized protein (DUF1501 family)